MKDISVNIIWLYEDGRESQNLVELDLNGTFRGNMSFKVVVEGEINQELSIAVMIRHIDSNKKVTIFKSDIEANAGDNINYAYLLKDIGIRFNGDGEYILQAYIIAKDEEPKLENLKSSLNLKITGFKQKVANN